MAAALALAACGGGGDDEPTADSGDDTSSDDAVDEAGAEGDDGDGGELSLSELKLTYEADRSTQLMAYVPAKARSWSEQFDSITMTATDDPVPALVSGSAWIVQNEPTLLWPAIEQGIVDGVIVGVFNDKDAWYMFGDENIKEPEDLIGADFSGGAVGDSWITVARIIMEEEFGIDPDDVNFVSIGGGSDARMEAMLAGQINGFMGQPRHVPPVEEGGGNVIYSDIKDMAQGMFMVERETMENHRDAVCAVLEGVFEAKQWIASGEESDWSDRMPEVIEYLQEDGWDTSDGGLAIENTWATSQQNEFNWSLDGGATAEAFDLQQQILSREGGEISPEFDWRDHVDFSCIWEIQEKNGLPLNPDPDSL